MSAAERILLIEDEKLIRMTLRELLEDLDVVLGGELFEERTELGVFSFGLQKLTQSCDRALIVRSERECLPQSPFEACSVIRVTRSASSSQSSVSFTRQASSRKASSAAGPACRSPN